MRKAFRSLLTLLKPAFAHLPEDLTGPENEAHRRELSQYFVQRRRGDIRHFLDIDTPFPERDDSEETYKLSSDYRRLFSRVLDYARETVRDPADGDRRRQRVRWWSALALLRSMASSPAAAAATLRTELQAPIQQLLKRLMRSVVAMCSIYLMTRRRRVQT